MYSSQRHDCGLCTKTHIARLDKHFKTVHGLKIKTLSWKHAVQSSRVSTDIELPNNDIEQRLEPGDDSGFMQSVDSDCSPEKQLSGESEQSAVQSTSPLREQACVVSTSTETESDEDAGVSPMIQGWNTQIFKDYATFTNGINPSVKRLDNSRTSLSRVREFLHIMSEGKLDEGLCFLDNYMRVYDWYGKIEGRGLAPSTLKMYRSDVRSFLKYLIEFRPQNMQAEVKMIRKMLLCFAKMDRSSRQSQATHKAQFRRRCRDEVLSAADLNRFVELSNRSIPDVLSRLEVRATSSDRRRFAALMSSRLAIFNGTRRSPVTMFSESDFTEVSLESGVYQMCVASHKTNSSFGECRIVLSQEEYTWLKQFHEIRPHLSGITPDTTLFFFTSCGKPYLNLCAFVGKIFAEFGIGSKVTFGTIRRSIATLNFNHGSVTDRGTVADHMCHSLETQSRYYRYHNLPRNASQARTLIERQINP
ncbi:uncharacterized protein ACWYII_009071 [Salvelinus alpinus]